nr:MAG TPA: hypothetical protein [Microviridae sp.]
MLKHSVVLKFNNVEMLKTMWKMLKTNRSNPESNGKVTAALRWKLRRVARNGGHLMKKFCKRLDNCKEMWYNRVRKRGKNHDVRIHRKQKGKMVQVAY